MVFISVALLFNDYCMSSRSVNGHLLLARLFKYCVRTSTDKASCGSSCRIFEALATVIDCFCERNVENQQALLPFISPFIIEYDGGDGGKKACACDNNSFLQVHV